MILKKFLLGLHLTSGIGYAGEKRIIEVIDNHLITESYPWNIETVLAVVRPLPQHVNKIKDTYIAACQQAAASQESYFTYFDDCYPIQLKEIFDPPLILFYEGNVSALKLPNLAVVGTRTATSYGLSCLRSLLPNVINRGTAIVSGLAKGIDVMAHQVTFANQGVPIAVIGTGLNVAYPARNKLLQQQVAQYGIVLSEYTHDVGPQKSHFPARNRIIAGLSSATLVIEAQIKSGSLITANYALQNNREVLSVPGPIFSENSRGTNELLKLGAKLISYPEEIIESVRTFG
ncbi:DNA-protecting protein DprA [Leuconostoc koreense]|nr:DNA-protecting protein DprA [Leuconostoc mesenteroides]QGM25948.1 DNA-protecting protein DprA [Leuconostoc mesenteroides subsp. mesenteroides]